MTKPHLSMKVRRSVWVEDEHPRDRVGKFIETLAEVKIWGGRLATVMRNVGGGRFEVEEHDSGRHILVHRNYLTVVARPDGSAPTDSRDANPAPVRQQDPTPDVVDYTPDVTRNTDADAATVGHGNSLNDLLAERDPELADLVRTAAADYVTALDNATPDDEADERAGLMGVLDEIDAAYGDDPAIRKTTATLRETAAAEPAAPTGVPDAAPDADQAFADAITEARDEGNPMATGILEVAHQNWRAGDQASAERLVDLGTAVNAPGGEQGPARARLRDLWRADTKPVYTGGNEGGPDGQAGTDRGTALEGAPADRVQGDRGEGPTGVLPDDRGRGNGADRGSDRLPDGAPDAGRGLRDDPGSAVDGTLDGGVPGDAGDGADRPGAGDAAEPGGPGRPGAADGDPGVRGGAGGTERAVVAEFDGGWRATSDGTSRNFVVIEDADGQRVGVASRRTAVSPWIGHLDEDITPGAMDVRGRDLDSAARMLRDEFDRHDTTAVSAPDGTPIDVAADLAALADSAEQDQIDAERAAARERQRIADNIDLYGSPEIPTDEQLTAEAAAEPDNPVVGVLDSGTVIRADDFATVEGTPVDTDGNALWQQTWPAVAGRRGAVRTTNGGETEGLLSSLGTSYSIQVTDDGGTTTIPAWRVAAVRVDPLPPAVDLTDGDAGDEDVADIDANPQPAIEVNPAIPPPKALATFKPPVDGNMVPAGKMAKLDANIAALQTLRRLQETGAPADPIDQEVLAKWAGWGGLPEVFDEQNAAYESRRQTLRGLMSESEWREGRRNTLNAHYTDPRVVAELWGAVEALGIREGRVLEPGSGSGTFIGHAPAGIHMTGVELDSTTAAISQYLYPDAQIRNESFADTKIPDGAFDAAVGNVPFGKFKLVDPVHNPDYDETIHNHFILKSLALTRPGGIVATLSSRYTLDAENERSRKKMYEQADLIGAIRLPAGSHARAAETDVIEDILIFRKRLPGEAKGDDSWVHSTKRNITGTLADGTEFSHDLPVNTYFDKHPDYVLGRTVASNRYGGMVDVVGDRDFPDLGATLTQIVGEAVTNNLTATERPDDVAPLPDIIAAGSERHEGHIEAAEDGTFTQAVNGASVPFEVPASQRDEFRDLIGLRDTLGALLDAESASGEDTQQQADLRTTLNAQYDAYLAKYGPINRYKFSKSGSRNRPGAPRLFGSDPLSASVRALETYDPEGDEQFPGGYVGTVQRASIFTTRAVAPRQIRTTADNPADALTLSMDTYGAVNMPAIAGMLGVDEAQAREQMRGLVYEVPDLTDVEQAAAEDAAFQLAETGNTAALDNLDAVSEASVSKPGRFVPTAEYLSGNVRKKLAAAQAAAAKDPRYQENVAALQGVIPTDLGPSEIDGRLGAAWVPADVVQDFVNQTLRIPTYGRTRQAEVRTSGGGIWIVDPPASYKRTNISVEEWGTEDRPFHSLVQSLLEQRSITVTRTEPDGHGGTRTYKDMDATLAAQAKAEAIQERFAEWLWEDPDRARRMQLRYNNQFNAIALRKYDGQSRAFPGMADTWKPHAHVKDAVERIVNEPTALLAHVVGAGKTAEMVMGSQELKRLGLARKPAIVVPNHMLEQFTREYLEIYPQAHLLAAGSGDLQGDKRREFVARAATGDWDAVILTQGAFESIPMSQTEQQAYIDREMATMRAQLEAARGFDDSNATKRTIKKMENAIISAENALKRKLAKTKDVGVTFEQTGIDYLMVDEAHMYSNLRTLSNIQGAGTDGSAKATDLHMKMEYLRATTKSGRVATFATGTPIRNTVTQAYVMQKFLRPDLLEEAGVHSFDQWAATFGSVVSEMELKPEGKGFRQTDRFAKFRNVPELLRMFHTFADVKLAEDLNLERPSVAGGGPQTVVVPRSDQLAEYINDLGDRAEKVRGGQVDPSEDNMLKISTDGRKAALSMALVGGVHEPGKIEAAADRIATIYDRDKDKVYANPKTGEPEGETGAFQIVFMDLGTPKGAKSSDDAASVDDNDTDFSGYDTLKAELVARGMPAEKIRYIHEAKNDREKAEMFAAARSGRISVLIGSSEKMGVGTNMQRRAKALHHLDAPWRPADVEQREGRIIRHGNLHSKMGEDVEIYRYVTEGSFDAYMWQTLERKAKFINQIMRGSLDVREIEDVGDTAMSYAEVKALATGNPDLLEKAKADTLLVKLQRLERTHARVQTNLTKEIERVTTRADMLEGEAAAYAEALPRAIPTRGDAFRMTVRAIEFDNSDENSGRAAAGSTLRSALVSYKDRYLNRYYDVPEEDIGTIGGFRIKAKFDYEYGWGGNTYSTRVVRLWLDGLPGSGVGWTPNDLEKINAAGLISRLENSIDSIQSRHDRLVTEAEASRTDVERMQARVGQPFARAHELAAIKAKSERLTAKIARDEKRAEGVEVEFDPHIDTDQYDDPIVRSTPGTTGDVSDASAPPEQAPARVEVSATALSVDDRIEFLRSEVSGELGEGRITAVRTVGNYVFVTVEGDDGKPYTRAFTVDAEVTKLGAPAMSGKGIPTLSVVDGKVQIVHVKRAGIFRETEHPRDARGRFIETFAEVRIWGGGMGKVTRVVGGGRVEVQRTDGTTVVVDSGNLTVTKTPDGVDVPDTDVSGGSPDAPAAPARPAAPQGTRPAPDARPENAVARFVGGNGERAWLEADPHEDAPVGYMQTDPNDPNTIVRYDNPEKWADDVDAAGMTDEPAVRGVRDNPTTPPEDAGQDVAQMSDEELDTLWAAQNLHAANNPGDAPFTDRQQAINDEHYKREAARTQGGGAPADKPAEQAPPKPPAGPTGTATTGDGKTFDHAASAQTLVDALSVQDGAGIVEKARAVDKAIADGDSQAEATARQDLGDALSALEVPSENASATDALATLESDLADSAGRDSGDQSWDLPTNPNAGKAPADAPAGFSDVRVTPRQDDQGVQKPGRLSGDGDILAVEQDNGQVAVYKRDDSAAARWDTFLASIRDAIPDRSTGDGAPSKEAWNGEDRFTLVGTVPSMADAEAGATPEAPEAPAKKPGIFQRLRDALGGGKGDNVYDRENWDQAEAERAKATAEAIGSDLGNTGKPDATGTLDDPIDVNGDLDKAVQLLAEGKHIRLNRVDEAGTLLDKLAAWAKDAEAKGEKAPVIDLCQVSVPDTNLFCKESKGIPRAQMPQLSGAPMPGSPADALPRNKRGRVDVTEQFKARLSELGVKVEAKKVPASSLKATQAQLNGVAVGGMMAAFRDGTMKDASIFVTRDNYVIDGHHRWAAKVGVDTADNSLGDVDMDVQMIDMEIGEAIDFANAFSYEQGIKQVAMGQPAVDNTLTPDPGAAPDVPGGTPDPGVQDVTGEVAQPGEVGDNANPALADTPDSATPFKGGAHVTSNVATLVESMGKVTTSADDNTTLPQDLADQAAEYDAAIATGDIKRKVAAHLALSKTLVEVNNLLDTGGTEPERQDALNDFASVNAIVDANVGRIFPPANAGGTPPEPDAPTVPEGVVKDMMGSAGRDDITDGGSAAAYLVQGADGQWRFTAERQALHDAIAASILDGVPVSDDPKYNFFGGGPASGKGGITRMFPALKEAAYINADEIKAVIPEMGMKVRAKDPSAAGFTHEESSYLAKVVQAEGFNRKVNVTLDGTGDSSKDGVMKKINGARKAGYKVDAYYVSVPADIAVERSIQRALTGVGADRGRFVPETVLRHTHASVSKVFPEVMNEFDSMVLFDTNVPFGSAPNLIARKNPGIDAEIVAEGKWQEFLDKANGFPVGH